MEISEDALYRCFIFVNNSSEESLPLILSQSKRFFDNDKGIARGNILVRINDADIRQESAKKCSKIINDFKEGEFYSLDVLKHDLLPQGYDAKNVEKVSTKYLVFT